MARDHRLISTGKTGFVGGLPKGSEGDVLILQVLQLCLFYYKLLALGLKQQNIRIDNLKKVKISILGITSQIKLFSKAVGYNICRQESIFTSTS